MNGLRLPRVMLVTDASKTRGRPLPEVVEAAVRGGLRLVQLRDRDLPVAERRRIARRLRALLPPDGVLLVNGDRELAAEFGAGLHDPAAAPAPEFAPPSPYGRSVHSDAELDAALAAGARYVVAGTVYPTDSKPGHPGGGAPFVRRMAGLTGAVPVFAIGGIDARNAPSVIAAGAWGVAVCSAILSAGRPDRAARDLIEAVRGAAEGSSPTRGVTPVVR